MPRRTIHDNPSSGVRAGRQQVAPQPKTFGEQVRQLWSDPRTQHILGIILLTLAVFLLISYVSYLFTGYQDIDVLQSGHAREFRGQIRNTLGLPGAWLGYWLINGSFGLMAAIPVLFLGLLGAKRLHPLPAINTLRVFFQSVFWLLWGDVTLGLVQHHVPLNGVSIRAGGMLGDRLSAWLESYVHLIGIIILLGAVLVIFLTVSDPTFISRCKQGLKRLLALCHRKPKENDSDNDNDNDNDDECPLDIDLTPETPDIEDTPEPGITIDLPVDLQITNQPDDSEAQASETPEPANEIQVEELNPDSPDEQDEQDAPEETALDINEPTEVELAEMSPEQRLALQGPYDPRKDLEFYKFPALDLLKVYDNETAPLINEEEQRANAARIVTTLRNYGIEIESIKATVGPTVTLYEVVPKTGTRINKIQALESDIMMSLAAMGIRIIAPIPGKSAVGIEVPNEKPQVVSMHSVIASKRFQEEQKMRLPIAIGRTITNEVFMFDLAKTPHLLVAGATGQGKSVAINAIITSLLYKKHPAELKLVMVDPKMVEFAPYKPLLKHYLAAMPDVEEDQVVITECDRVINTLNSLVIEMENRYKLLMDAGVRNLEDYNDKFIQRRLNPERLVADSLHHQYLPYIVIIIDEYGDFIMQAGKQVETPIARITQKARAVGMHMILATQRPSVNIVTGVIKANIPTRIALRTQSVIDSRTVLDVKGAEQLIGRGDMLYAGNGNVTRIQCAFVDTPEVDHIVEHIEKQQHYTQPYQLPEYIGEGQEGEALAPGSVDLKRLDPMFADVARYVVSKQEGSTSRLQRAFEVGYNRAGKLSDQLEAAGIVGPNKGPKGRDVLIQDMSQLEALLKELNA